MSVPGWVPERTRLAASAKADKNSPTPQTKQNAKVTGAKTLQAVNRASAEAGTLRCTLRRACTGHRGKPPAPKETRL